MSIVNESVEQQIMSQMFAAHNSGHPYNEYAKEILKITKKYHMQWNSEFRDMQEKITEALAFHHYRTLHGFDGVVPTRDTVASNYHSQPVFKDKVDELVSMIMMIITDTFGMND